MVGAQYFDWQNGIQVLEMTDKKGVSVIFLSCVDTSENRKSKQYTDGTAVGYVSQGLCSGVLPGYRSLTYA